MNQILIVVLAIACFVLAVDLLTTHLRKRARFKSGAPEPTPTKQDAGAEPHEGVALELE